MIKSQEIVRIIKNHACKNCIKIEAKKTAENLEISPDSETLTSNTRDPVVLNPRPGGGGRHVVSDYAWGGQMPPPGKIEFLNVFFKRLKT